MYITLKYEVPISHYKYIPEGTELELIDDFNDYEGFTAVKYNGQQIFLNSLYFVEIPKKQLISNK